LRYRVKKSKKEVRVKEHWVLKEREKRKKKKTLNLWRIRKRFKDARGASCEHLASDDRFPMTCSPMRAFPVDRVARCLSIGLY